MSEPRIAQFGIRSSAYVRAVQIIQQAIVAGAEVAVTVEPYDGGWRVVTFDHTPAVA